MANSTYTKDTFKNLSTEFKIGAIISDGMWYSLPKWRKMAKVTEEEINEYVERNMANGMLVQSPTGAKSFRFPLESIEKWYDDNGIRLGSQLIDFLFPPRIWDNRTEAEGFLEAPLREIGIVSYSATTEVSAEVAEALRGVAKVREAEPGRYKAYCLNAAYTKDIIESVLDKHPVTSTHKTYSRSEAKRRELADFSSEFARGLVMFYKVFGRSLVKKEMETIRIYLPDTEDQESQITLWVLTAIEKFDESSSVPFSGYLNSVLKRWPYDLPATHLGKDLSAFQRQRSRAIEALKLRVGEDRNFTNVELAGAMELDQTAFNDLEEKHRVWTKSRTATTLNWDESADEKMVKSNLSGEYGSVTTASDILLANKMSIAVIQAAINTELYDDAFSIITQIDSSELNLTKIKEVSEPFIQELGFVLGLEGDS